MYRAGAYANASGTAATAFLGQNGPAGNSSGGQTDQMSFPHRIFYDTRLQTLWVAGGFCVLSFLLCLWCCRLGGVIHSARFRQQQSSVFQRFLFGAAEFH